MITLVTGTPGSGKSAFALSLMLNQIKQGRPLYVHGVPNLNIPHIAVSCQSPTCDACLELDWPTLYRMPSADTWHLWAPDGAVLWFDEVQHIHRPRASGSKVPDVVGSYETHRHKGLDFFMVTQHPRLIDSNVRQLVGRHVHLVSSWKGRTMYEWPEVSDNPQSTGDAIKSAYALPKHVFPLYKSATIHIKPVRKIPPQVFLLAFCLFAVIAGVVRFYYRFAPAEDVRTSQTSPSLPDHHESDPLPLRNSGGTAPIPTIDQARFDYNPKIPNVPESAPAFADLAKPVTFPKMAGCVVSRDEPDGCRCYTQQATPYFVSPDQCRAFVKYGRFDPYKPDGSGRGVAETRTGGDVRAELINPAQPGQNTPG